MTDTWRTARWLQQHPTIARLLHRVPPIRRWLSARVWREAEADPAFVAAMEQGMADVAAGRVVPWEAVERCLDVAVGRTSSGPKHYWTNHDGSAL